MSTWLERCKEELQRAGAFDPKSDFYGGNTGKAVMELLELFDKQNHSGMSASLVASLFKQLVDGKPLTPLTGNDDEWIEIEPGVYQNKRCPSVFKDEKGAYQIDYYIFQDESGAYYTSKESIKYIDKFPYYPKHEYIHYSNNHETNMEGK